MRMLGIRAGLPAFRWDLVYLLASLLADERQEIQALAPPVESLLATLKTERDLLEQAEDGAVIGTARRKRRDEELDSLLIRSGTVARASDATAYATLFPNHNPSKTARLPLDEEVFEVGRILGELAVLPADHPLRVAYEAPLTAALASLKAAMLDSVKADTDLALSRSRQRRFKLDLDKARVEVHGKLLMILKEKAAADSFFRSVTKAPGAEEEEEEEPAPEAEPQKA